MKFCSSFLTKYLQRSDGIMARLETFTIAGLIGQYSEFESKRLNYPSGHESFCNIIVAYLLSHKQVLVMALHFTS